MATVERLESWRGQDVLDSAGGKVGRLEEVYYDAMGEEPVLVSIKHGLLGRQLKLAPLADAVASRDYLRLGFSGEQVGGSPNVTVEDEISAEHSASVCALFGVAVVSNGPLFSSSLLERRHAEAERAKQREHQLTLEAEQRKQEADRRKQEAEEAQRRAGAAAEEAQAAQRERAKAEAAASDPAGSQAASDPPGLHPGGRESGGPEGGGPEGGGP